jgi:hypothetical protein
MDLGDPSSESTWQRTAQDISAETPSFQSYESLNGG